jgi:hypothetical protein
MLGTWQLQLDSPLGYYPRFASTFESDIELWRRNYAYTSIGTAKDREAPFLVARLVDVVEKRIQTVLGRDIAKWRGIVEIELVV